MSLEMAKQGVKVLQDNFKREFPQVGIRGIWKELCQQSDKAISDAVDELCLNHSFLPSPAQFLEKVKIKAKMIAAKEAKEREDEWNRTKGGETRKELERQGSIFTKEQSDAHGKHAVQALKLMMTDASHQDKLECFKAMDQSYPGLLWLNMGMSAQKDIERCGRIKSVSPAYDGK